MGTKKTLGQKLSSMSQVVAYFVGEDIRKGFMSALWRDNKVD